MIKKLRDKKQTQIISKFYSDNVMMFINVHTCARARTYFCAVRFFGTLNLKKIVNILCCYLVFVVPKTVKTMGAFLNICIALTVRTLNFTTRSMAYVMATV